MRFGRLSALHAHLRLHTFSTYWIARQHARALIDVRKTDTMLEIGCGAGKFTSIFAPKAKTYTALDLELEHIVLAKKWRGVTNWLPLKNVIFAQANALALPYPNNTFDKVIAIDVIEHVPEHYEVLKEIRRVLKPNGTIVMTTMLADRPSYFKRLVFTNHVREYDTSSFRDLFDSAALNIKEIFYFYYLPTMATRELQAMMSGTAIGKIPIIQLIPSFFLSLGARLESFAKIGRPGGIGIYASKT